MSKPTPVIVAMYVLVAAACDQSNAEPKPEPAAPAEPPSPTKQSATPTSATAAASVKVPLQAYEKIRAMLADDQTKGLSASAEKLSKSARSAAAKAPAKLKKHLESLAKAASELGRKPTSDMDEVRRAYGEVSRHVVALLIAEPSLRKGRYVFECPMAQGYKKWVQNTPKISNPYMGKKMLRCGGKSEWEE